MVLRGNIEVCCHFAAVVLCCLDTQSFLVFDDPYHSLLTFALYASSLTKISENHSDLENINKKINKI